MLSIHEKLRYKRHLAMPEVGAPGQEALKKARVLVVGAGGIGCPVLQYLAAAGVGTLGVVDFDKVDASNLQRQILYSIDQVGKLKVECSAQAIFQINPFVEVVPYPVRISNQNALEIISKYDIVVDGSDNFSTRYLVNDACYLLKKPLVFGAIHKFEGQVSVFHLTESSPSYRSVFPEVPKQGAIGNCEEIGVLGILTGIIGSMMAAEVFKIITGIGMPLDGKLLNYNALDQTMYNFLISADVESVKKLQPGEDEFISSEYNFECQTEATKIKSTITAFELMQTPENFRIIDIRELNEQPKAYGFSVEFWPLSTQSSRPIQFDDRPTVIFCQKGLRSKALVEKVLESSPDLKIYTLEGGLETILDFPF